MDTFQKEFMEMLEEEFITNPEKAENIDFAEMIENLTPELTSTLRSSLESTSDQMLKERREQFTSFTQRNEDRWKDAFDLLETHIAICTETGESINTEQRSIAVKENNIKFDILVRHHARACHIANEILCLLKNGFPDAAHSRWRALHEVNVTAMFIEKHGQECARRFYFHDIIDSYDGMKEHKKYEHRLNEKAPEQSIIDSCKLEYNNAIKEFGKGFERHYGWAAHFFTERTPRSVGFASLEKDVGLDHMRPYYKWASQNIHAGAKGTRNRLALAECNDEILVVGQSNSGMADPGHATALSLMQVTLNLLKIAPNLDHIVLMNLLKDYSDEIGETFLRVSRKADS
ncbi:MAG: hypothetical protein ACI9OE_002884 [Mariniflexile sp.]|jgi:hypothetical protein